MAERKAKEDVTLKVEKTFTVYLDNGDTVSVTATNAPEAVKKALKKE
jgi:hypothetical protein